MVVVENGRRYLHQDVLVQVTKVLQTNAGRLNLCHAGIIH
jgi:uncharacterized protein YacL